MENFQEKKQSNENTPPIKISLPLHAPFRTILSVFQMPTLTETCSLINETPRQAGYFFVQSPSSGETRGYQLQTD